MNIFERASRNKLRFSSKVGELNVEQLWDLPLTGPAISLDGLYRTVNRELKDTAEEGYVNVTPNPRKSVLELSLEILKHIIDVKMADKERAEKAKETAEKKRKLLAILEQKEESELAGKTKEEIRAELEKLGA
jgi:hypothetical protein